MALEFISRVLSIYKGDTSDLKAKIKELTGEEKKLAEERLKGVEAANKANDSIIKGIGEVKGFLGDLRAAAQFVWDGFKLGAERARLSAAALGANIEALQRASFGLRSETDLLRDAAKFQSGEFKLTQVQMEATERAQLALNRKFQDGGEASKKLTQAVVELKTDALQELGIPIDKAGLSMEKATDRAELFRRVMVKVAEVGGQVKEGQLAAGESMEQATIQLRDSWDKLKISIGQLATAFEPLIRALSSVLDFLGSAELEREGGFLNVLHRLQGERERKQMSMVSGQFGSWRQGDVGVSGPLYDAMHPTPGDPGAFFTAPSLSSAFAGAASLPLRDDIVAGRKEALARLRERNKAILIELLGALDESNAELAGIADQIREEGNAQLTGFGGEVGLVGSSVGSSAAAARRYLGQFQEGITRESRYGAFAGARSRSRLEAMFGPIEEFSAYRTAFDALSGSVTSAMDAWITGSVGAGEAVQKFLAGLMKGLATTLVVEGLKHGAYSVGSLAFGDVPGAAAHAKAALLFAGAGAAAAVAARELGGSSGGGARASAGGAYTPGAPTTFGGGPPARGGGQPIVVVYNNSWSRQTPRQQALEAERAVADAFAREGY